MAQIWNSKDENKLEKGLKSNINMIIAENILKNKIRWIIGSILIAIVLLSIIVISISYKQNNAYISKNVNGKELYYKVLSTVVDGNSIAVTGYMPKNSEIKAIKVEKEESERKASEKAQRNVNLLVAYDIKIISDGEEYEPYKFDEKLLVEIQVDEDKKYEVWHFKENNEIELMERTEEK